MIHLIQTQAQLDQLKPLFSQLIDQNTVMAVDTEFLREKTYNARLCLLQLGIGDDQYCIDVLAIDDLSSLVELFTAPSVLKLLHAARQDMEVLWQTMGVLPKPVFDTQLAAAFCGMDLQIGHTALVEELLGITLSKSQARTDWSRRPLSQEQIDYAAEDVTYLSELHQIFVNKLQQADKLDWFEQEIVELYDIDKYEIEPAKAYQRLSGGSLNLLQQYTLKALAEWRETMAQKRDIPRSWVLRDDRLYELATRRPTSESVIKEMSVFGRKSAHRLAPQAAKLIAKVEAQSEPLWKRSDPLDKEQKARIGQMMAKLKDLAAEHNVAQGLLATRRDLEKLYRDQSSKKLLNGWRKTLVGEPLLEMAKDS